MPEVPDQQAPSSEEAKLGADQLPQPSEATLDQQTVEQQQNQVDPDLIIGDPAPSEGGNVVPVEPSEGLQDPQSSPKPEYKEGDSFSFTAPNGESYGIAVVKVEGDQVTIQNSTPGTEPITLPLEKVREILESPART